MATSADAKAAPAAVTAATQSTKDIASAADAAFKELYGWYHGGNFYNSIQELWTNVNGHAVQSSDVKASTAHILGTLNANPQTQKDAQAIQKYAALSQNDRLKYYLTNLGDTGTPSWGDIAVNNAKNVASAVGSLNPLGALFQKAIWLRVAEVGLGIILLAIGIAKLTNAVPIATKIGLAAGMV